MKKPPTGEREQTTKDLAAFIWLSRHPRSLAIGLVLTTAIYAFFADAYGVNIPFQYVNAFVPPLMVIAVVGMTSKACGLAAKAARSSHPEKFAKKATQAWRLLSIASVILALTLIPEVPFLGVFRDPFALLGPFEEIPSFIYRTLLLVALLIMPVGRRYPNPLHEVVIGACIATLILGFTVLSGEFIPYIIELTPVLLDIALITAALFLVLRAQSPNFPVALLLAAGILARYLTVYLFVAVPTIRHYVPSGLTTLVEWGLIFAASLRPIRSTTERTNEDQWPWIVKRIPTILVSSILIILTIIWFNEPSVASIATAVGLGLIVLELARGFTGVQRPTERREWRSRLRSRELLLPVLGLVVVWLLYQTLFVSPRPSDYTQSIAIAVRDLHPKPDAGFRIDVHMTVPTSLFGGCRNPVQVAAVISGTPDLWNPQMGSPQMNL
jgi:hypothetical protein